MPNAKILIIDDEPGILNLVDAYLRAEGFTVYTAADGLAGLKAVQAYHPDLVILDIMLPGIDGIELLTRLRRESDVYVIMLTARAEETDKIIGLSVGADDYVTKPFSPRELVARVKATLRRAGNHRNARGPEELVFPHIRIDPGAREVRVDGRLVDLTAMEFNLLETLARHSGLVLSREQLLEKVWGIDYYGEMRVVDVHIGHIRQKLGEEFIATVRGVGYRFIEKRQ